MKPCRQCGGEIVVLKGMWHYTECGLDHVYLANVERRECQQCGDKSVVIPQIQDLHALIASELARSPQRLTGVELRYLRKYLGISREDLGRMLGADENAVTRWEASGDIGRTIELLLRVLVIRGKPAEEYPVDKLEQLGIDPPDPARRIDVKKAPSGWTDSHHHCAAA